MNALLINWKNPNDDIVVTIGWLYNQDFESITLCTDLVKEESRTTAHRGIVIQRCDIVDITELAPLPERRQVELH